MTRNRFPHAADIDAAAASWFSRVRSGTLSEIDEIALEDWIDRDPAHRSAYDAVERAWGALEAVRMHPRVLAMRDVLPARRPPRLSRYVPPVAIAACLALVVFSPLVVGVQKPIKPAEAPSTAGLFQNRLYNTGEKERIVITLPDGSEVMLNGDARLRTIADHDRRMLRLEKGEAFFRVAKDPVHPFIVHAGDRTITAVGTAFEVSVEDQRFAITLVEGRVRVQTPVVKPFPLGARPNGLAAPSIETTEIVAGTQLAASAKGWSTTRADVDEATRWTRDQLVFEAKPLAEVVAQMNQRSPRKIVVLDEAVGQTLISGNFRPGDVDGFVSALAAYKYATASTRPDGTVELSSP